MLRSFGRQSHREIVQTGKCLLDRVLRHKRKLFISEDVGAIESAFQNEIQLISDVTTLEQIHGSSFGKWRQEYFVVIVAVLIALSSINYYYHFIIIWPLLLLLFCSTLFVIAQLVHRKRPVKFCEKFIFLTDEFLKEKELYKKLLQLIEDNIVFTDKDNENQPQRVESLEFAFRDIGLEGLLCHRHFTSSIVCQFPLKIDDNEELICQLPDILFEQFKDEKLSLKTLKTLKKLIHLQMSELLKRLFFIFIRNYYKSSEEFDPYLHIDLLNSMLTQSCNRQKELLTVIYYHKSLYEPDRVEPLTLDRNSPTNLWPVCRNIRKSLYTALSIVDDFDLLINSQEQLASEEKTILERKLEILNGELASIQESTRSILKIITLKASAPQDHEGNFRETSQLENINYDDKRISSEEEYVAPDEVFEAYVPYKLDNDSISDMDANDTIDLIQEIEASNNVYRELKHALKDKAIEHKVREAKVLGIEVDVQKLQEEYAATEIEKEENPNENKRMSAYKMESTAERDPSPTPASYNFAFNFDIALKATEKMRLLMDTNEDTFECDTELCDTGEEEST